MTEPDQLFLTLSCTTQDGVIHRRHTVLDVATLEKDFAEIKHELFSEYVRLKSRFRSEVDYGQATTVS